MEKVENEEKSVVPSEKHYENFEPAAVPVAPDGGVPMGFASEQPPGPLELNEDTMVCLRGPCRFYWHLVTQAGGGNPAGTFEALGLEEPRQHHHTCLANPGMETDLTDDNVFECSKWDPLSSGELVQIRARRDGYWKTKEGND